MIKRPGLVCLIVFTSLISSIAEAAAHDRILQKIEKTSSFMVKGNVHLIYVNSNNGVFDSLQYAIDQNLAPVISISYGDCEKNFSAQDVRILGALGQQATAQGITILAASGDTGAADCDYNARIASRGLAVDVPASLPYVTGLGGSEFQEDANSWSATNNATNGSALSYIAEATWNDSAATGVLSAGGGGRSIYFSKPDWQAAAGRTERPGA
jgi:subtilase family serine protease